MSDEQAQDDTAALVERLYKWPETMPGHALAREAARRIADLEAALAAKDEALRYAREHEHTCPDIGPCLLCKAIDAALARQLDATEGKT